MRNPFKFKFKKKIASPEPELLVANTNTNGDTAADSDSLATGETANAASSASAANAKSTGHKSPIATLWGFALPILLGLTLGWFATVCLATFLTRAGFVVSHQGAVGVNNNSASSAVNAEARGMDEFLAANPFRVSPKPEPVDETPVVSEDTGPKIIGSLATAVLKGTFPDVGVWLEDKGVTRLVLIDSSFDVYTLVAVSYRDAVFMKDDEIVVRDMNFGEPTVARRPAASTASTAARASSAPVGDIVPAVPGEQDGAVPSGLVNDLVQNPFEELKKVRLRPRDDQPGLEIQWIQEDSILSQLGVQKGDVVKAVNGIEFTNMADIANSINSLMNSERFDVEVERDGKKTALRYVVR